MKNADMPAMPVTEEEYSPDRDEYALVQRGGLTKREHFAAMAMQGRIASSGPSSYGAPDAIEAARDAVAIADALLAELEKTNG